MLQPAEAKHVLQRLELPLVLAVNNAVHVAHNARQVGAAVLWHAALYGQVVPPVVVNGFHGSAAGVVGPEGAWRQLLRPGGKGTSVASSNVDPGLINS